MITFKVDADAVFKPEKLISRIHLMPIPQKGGFLVNCEKVKYGFFGNLEVFDKTAFSILAANIDSCSKTTVSNWKVGIDKGKYGPMGEDLFAEMCMKKNGVTAIEAFDLSKDGCCEAKRPGNEKKNKKILEPATIGEESVAKKLTSVKTAKPNAQMFGQW